MTFLMTVFLPSDCVEWVTSGCSRLLFYIIVVVTFFFFFFSKERHRSVSAAFGFFFSGSPVQHLQFIRDESGRRWSTGEHLEKGEYFRI